MYIENIELQNFRNYKKASINFDKNINIIIGNNGQGKTNLIEAIFVAAVGKSFRTSKDSNLINFNSTFASIVLNYIKENEKNKLEVIIKNNKKKAAKLNGINLRKLSELIDNVFVVIFSPEDLKMVKDEPEKRRRFIDIELSKLKPSYYLNLANYKKILLQRNAYLKNEKIEKKVIDVWDEELVKYGSRLILQRKDFIDKISKISKKIHKEITNEKEEITINYLSSIDYDENEEKLKRTFINNLNKNFKNDIKQKTTTCGPHKDDIQFFINGINARKYGSQGQQRTVALSVKLSELRIIKEETGEEGILLLDDVMSELDKNRQKYLINTFKDNQLFVTTTNINEELKNNIGKNKTIIIKEGNEVKNN